MKPQAVVATVAKHFGLPAEVLTGRSRVRSIAYARHLTMYLLVTRFGMSYYDTAVALGRLNHTTAWSAVQRITSWRRGDVDNVCIDLEALEWKLRPTRYRRTAQGKEA